MKYLVTINDQPLTVEISEQAGELQIMVDG